MTKVLFSSSESHIHPYETHVIGSNVTSAGSEALGERSHHDVHIGRVTPPVLDHAPSAGSHGSNTVSLVQIQVSLEEYSTLIKGECLILYTLIKGFVIGRKKIVPL